MCFPVERDYLPITVTPLWLISFPGLVATQFPPASAARSTTTEPGFMAASIWELQSMEVHVTSILQLTSSVISFGAGLPGINAVVITISTSLHCSRKSFISASMNSLDISFAYPPAPDPSSSISTSMNSAPRDCTCSRAAGLVSKPRTTAPSRRA